MLEASGTRGRIDYCNVKKFFIVMYKPFENKLIVNKYVVVVADDTWASHGS